MDLLYKEDASDAKKRLTAWWNREIIDRVPVMAYAPRKGCENLKAPQYKDLQQYWNDYDYIKEEMLHICKTRFFGGEAFPILTKVGSPNNKVSSRNISYTEETVWYEPVIDDLNNAPSVVMKADSENFKAYEDHYRRLVNDAYGYYYVPIYGVGLTGDSMSSLRGPERLCMDLIDNPERIKELENEINGKDWFEVYDRLYSVVSQKLDGMGYWWLTWAPGKTCSLQNDFSAMISNAMFKEFYLDNLIKQIKHMDYSMYHLDGPDAVRHLDCLLEIDELDAIQFIPGSGSMGYRHYVDVLKRILDAGKSTYIAWVTLKEMEELMSVLPSKGLLFSIYCATQDEAEYALKQAEKYTAQYAGIF